jgi:Protein of unknown function (DUF2909)
MNYWILVAFVAILVSLGFALFYLLRGGTEGKIKTNRMARALAFRVGFSIMLFLCILVGWKLGLIHPTGIPLNG